MDAIISRYLYFLWITMCFFFLSSLFNNSIPSSAEYLAHLEIHCVLDISADKFINKQLIICFFALLSLI